MQCVALVGPRGRFARVQRSHGRGGCAHLPPAPGAEGRKAILWGRDRLRTCPEFSRAHPRLRERTYQIRKSLLNPVLFACLIFLARKQQQLIYLRFYGVARQYHYIRTILLEVCSRVLAMLLDVSR